MRFFLNSLFYSGFAFLFIVLWMLGLYYFFLFALVIFSGFLFFSRRLPPSFFEDPDLKEGILFSPVNGRVLKVNKGVDHPTIGNNLNEVVIVSSWLREHGIYFPTRSEIIGINYETKKGHFRYAIKGHFKKGTERIPSLSIALRSIDSTLYGLDFYKCPLGLWPKVRVIPGDRGKAQVNLGFFGLGGTTVLYFPENYEISVKEGLDLIAGQSIIGNLG